MLLKAFPEVVPGTTFRESLIGQAALELSHVENLPERLPIVAAAALIAAAAIGLGEIAVAALRLREILRLAERLALDFGLGMRGWACSHSCSAARACFLPGSSGSAWD